MRKITAILALVVVYGVFVFLGDVKQFPNPMWLVLFSLITLGGYFFRSLRWKLLMDSQDMKISMWDAFKTYIAGLAFIVTPGKIAR